MTSLESNAIPNCEAMAHLRPPAIALARRMDESGEAIPDVMAELSAHAQASGMGYD
ncbi:hypothetical protein [Burkholderia sp. JP2-270]|uniref:hypothetical protein n=1 Tax=Burkholderia sp. JP2-270 TaxID=2217913 RepID=UPI0013A6C1FD|nr:hypothetical protein [Burkholderia sp. JP2-270]